MTEGQLIHAVLTGDIVGSSRLSPDERRLLHSRFNQDGVRLERAFGDQLLHKPEIVRGDSWQFAVAGPQGALRIALFFRALIQFSLPGANIDTRLAIGVGSIDFLPGDELTSGDGEAYRLSGEGLESLQKPFYMGLFMPERYQSQLASALDVIVKLLDRQVCKWTEAQAESVAGALLGFTQQKIATEWVEREITQQAVAQHLDRAGWASIEVGLRYYEQTLPSALSGAQDQV
jgi:hypothetical protein